MELTKEVDNRLAEIALKYSFHAEGEAGLLYTRLRKWYIKYGTFPTTRSVKQIARFIVIDEKRVRNKYRMRDGKAVGTGSNARVVSIEEKNADSDSDLSYLDILTDSNAILPNEIERFDKNLLLEACGNKAWIVEYIFFGGITRQEIAEFLEVSEAYISQILHKCFRMMKSRYEEIALIS